MPSHFKLFSRCRGGNTVRNGGNNMHSDACAAEAATRKTETLRLQQKQTDTVSITLFSAEETFSPV